MQDKYFFEVDVPNFIDKIELSKKRRPAYYKDSDRIPKKYSTDEFCFENNILVKKDTHEKVIKNQRTVGTPNIKIITGQYFWTGAHPHIRRKIKRDMSDFFWKYLKDAPEIKECQYPIGIRIDLYDIIQGQDIDNFIFLYRKVIHDVLTANECEHRKIIIDDSREYVQDIPTRFFEIESHEDRFLKIQIYSI